MEERTPFGAGTSSCCVDETVNGTTTIQAILQEQQSVVRTVETMFLGWLTIIEVEGK